MKNSIINVYSMQVTTDDIHLILINNKFVDNIAETFSLATLAMFRTFLRSQILCKVK